MFESKKAIGVYKIAPSSPPPAKEDAGGEGQRGKERHHRRLQHIYDHGGKGRP